MLQVPRFICILLFGFLVVEGKAQHCPFDGSYVVVVKLLLPSGVDTPALWLRQQEPVSDSCAYGSRLVARTLYPDYYWQQQAITDVHGQHHRWLFPGLQKDADFLSGHMAVFLSSSSRYCMVPDGNNMLYQPRSFVLSYSYGGRVFTRAVAPSDVYHLCSTAGSWSRIKPMLLYLAD